jgi:hypothetical protein
LTLDNKLSFAGRNQRPCDADITAAIQDKLLWSFHVDGDRISVAVADWQAVKPDPPGAALWTAWRCKVKEISRSTGSTQMRSSASSGRRLGKTAGAGLVQQRDQAAHLVAVLCGQQPRMGVATTRTTRPHTSSLTARAPRVWPPGTRMSIRSTRAGTMRDWSALP